MATLNVSGWNFHVGSTVGYLGAKSRDTSSAGPLNNLGGTFQDTLQVPFVGFYAVATKGRFFIDGMLRGDFYQNNLNDPLISGIFNQKLDARGLAFSGNVGYNIPLQNNWFIEPSAGIVVSKVKVDPLNVTGTGLAAVIAGGTVGTFPGQLRINDINSTLGRLSVRGGTTIASGNMIWQPFVTAERVPRVPGQRYFELRWPRRHAVHRPLPACRAALVSTSNIGTYGQIGVGVSGQIVNTGWLGYVRGDYRARRQHRRLQRERRPSLPVHAGHAVAEADVCEGSGAEGPAAIVGPYNWTGFYVGGSVGVLNGRST